MVGSLVAALVHRQETRNAKVSIRKSRVLFKSVAVFVIFKLETSLDKHSTSPEYRLSYIRKNKEFIRQYSEIITEGLSIRNMINDKG